MSKQILKLDVGGRSAGGEMTQKITLILSCLLASILHIDCFDLYGKGFVKRGNSFEASSGNESSNAFPEEYVDTVGNLLRDYKAGHIQHEALNTFEKGLEEYFLFRLHERTAIKSYAAIPLYDISDPLPLPDHTILKIRLKNATVFGFAGLEKHGRPVAIDGIASSTESKITLRWKLDVIVFKGNFEIHNCTYFFAYTLRQNHLTTYIHAYQDLNRDPIFVKNTLNFSAEQLLHTYDSSYQGYVEASEIFVHHFNHVLSQHYLPNLAASAIASYGRSFYEYDLQLRSSYKKSILSAIVESAIQYGTAKGLNSFEVALINYTTLVDFRKSVLSFRNITVQGILNFVNHRVINATNELPERRDFRAKLSEVIELTYADEGEKQAYLSFVIGENTHEHRREFKIDSIRIVAVYNSTMNGKIPKVLRDKEAFGNGSGFSIKFKLRNFDCTYEFLIEHVVNHVVRGFQRILGAKDDIQMRR